MTIIDYNTNGVFGVTDWWGKSTLIAYSGTYNVQYFARPILFTTALDKTLGTGERLIHLSIKEFNDVNEDSICLRLKETL